MQNTIEKPTLTTVLAPNGDGLSIRRVCFVCTGNTCRSPMAAALYNHLHADQPTQAISAGLAVNEGEPLAKNALLALQNYGVPPSPKNDYPAHRATQLTSDMVSLCDELYALTSQHYMALCMAFPEAVGKLHLLGEIADPYGGDLSVYERTLSQIREALT